MEELEVELAISKAAILRLCDQAIADLKAQKKSIKRCSLDTLRMCEEINPKGKYRELVRMRQRLDELERLLAIHYSLPTADVRLTVTER